MSSIIRQPKSCKPFFNRIRDFFDKDSASFNHAWRIILAIASSSGRISLSKLSDTCQNRRSRQAISSFLNSSPEKFRSLLQKQALQTLKRLGWKPGARLYLTIDDTQIQKYGKDMEGLSKIWLHSEKKFATGHTVLLCSLVYRNATVPFDFRLWLSEETCSKLNQDQEQRQFVKLTNLAAECIRSLKHRHFSNVTVLFDRYYLCNAVLEAIREKGVDYVGAVKRNRIFVKDSNAYNIGTYSERLLDSSGQKKEIQGSQCKIAETVGHIRKVGAVKVVCSQRSNGGQRLILATNKKELKAEEIIKIYRNRWSIEVLFKMSKQYLGMGDYQFLKLRGIEGRLCFVMCAHIYLTHQALDELDEKEMDNNTIPLCLVGIGQAKKLLCRKLLLDQLEYVKNGISKKTILKRVSLLEQQLVIE